MKQIPLTQGKFALVDDADFNYLNQWKWYAKKGVDTFYAKRDQYINRKRNFIWMHRLILHAPDNMEVDHISHNGLDNRRGNLRLVTHQQNCMNQQVRKDKSSKFKGVYWDKQCKAWVAKIQNKKKRLNLGYFDNEIDAAIMYNQKAVELFGEYAWLNPILDEYKSRIPIRREKAKAECSSPHNGVTWYTPSQKWCARITKNKKTYHLGYFFTEEAAYQAYLKAHDNQI